jgi:hypothetical protein
LSSEATSIRSKRATAGRAGGRDGRPAPSRALRGRPIADYRHENSQADRGGAASAALRSTRWERWWRSGRGLGRGRERGCTRVAPASPTRTRGLSRHSRPPRCCRSCRPTCGWPGSGHDPIRCPSRSRTALLGRQRHDVPGRPRRAGGRRQARSAPGVATSQRPGRVIYDRGSFVWPACTRSAGRPCWDKATAPDRPDSRAVISSGRFGRANSRSVRG